MRRTVTTIALAAVGLLGLAACGSEETPAGTPAATTSAAPASSSAVESPESSESSEEESTEAESSTSEESTDESTSESATSEESTEASSAAEGGSASGAAAPWATPLLTPGENLGTVSGDGIDVTVFQAGTAPATKTGFFADPDTNEPIIAVGDELVFVTYLVTNTGSEPIPLGSSLAGIDARYDDWPYLGGMDGVTDFDLTESMGVNKDAVEVSAIADPPIYVLGPGESYSVSENFLYQAGSELILDVTVTPVDDAGDLVHDDKVEFEGSVTIA